MQRILLPPRTSHVITVQAQEAGCPCSDKEPDPDWRFGNGQQKANRPVCNEIIRPSESHSRPQEKAEQFSPRVSREPFPRSQRRVEPLHEGQRAGCPGQHADEDQLSKIRRCCRHHRSEEHTSELQSPCNLVCRLLLEKKKKNNIQKLYMSE